MPALVNHALLSALTRTPKEIPVSFLYDDKGSEIYEEITALEEYYPFRAEAELLRKHVDDIVGHIPKGSVVVELGCGTARKTVQILKGVAARHGSCRFAGIDVSASFLEEARTNILKEVPGMKPRDITLVEADYMVGLKAVREAFKDDNLCILWLGSSAGNLSDSEAVQFMKKVVASAGTQHQFLLCTDLWKKESILYAAYHDSLGVTERFIKNGARNAFESLGYKITDQQEASWVYQVDVNKVLRRVEMWVKFPEGMKLERHGVTIEPGERILMEVSRKFTVDDLVSLATSAKYCVHAAWRDSKYGIQLMLPAEEALRQSWRDMDSFFETIGDWSIKPIDLRHPFCFYYGHVVAFSKLKMLSDQPATKSDVMFSRGIDPIVLDPSKCHSHPEAPKKWPSKEEIVDYVKNARALMLKAVASDKVPMYVLNLSLEHERMHSETLCYMLAQETKRRLDTTGKLPVSLPTAEKAPKFRVPKTSQIDTHISSGEVTLGVEISDTNFVWDNEGPQMKAIVDRPFAISSAPVSIGEFQKFITEELPYANSELWDAEDFEYFRCRGQSAPATWSLVGGEWFVNYPEGSHHWSEVADKPVFVSLSEAMAFCTAKGFRIMSEAEYQRVLDCAEGESVQQMRDGGWEWTSSLLAPFPGFEPLALYPEYSTDFFDGLHYVLKGSSPYTHPSLIRDSFRNYYQKQYPFVFAKFRICKDA